MLEFFPACLVILSTILVINVSLYTIQDISLLVIAREWIKGESTVISMFFFFGLHTSFCEETFCLHYSQTDICSSLLK